LCELAVDPLGGESLLQETDIAQHHSEKVVEIVRHPRCELADRFQPLHLVQGGLDPLAFLDLPEQLAIGRRQLRRPLFNVRFQFLVEPPTFVLPSSAAQSGADHADECRRVEWPLQERDVTEEMGKLRRRRVALEPSAVLGQEDEGKIRPRRLIGDPTRDRPHVVAAGGFLGDDGDVGTAFELLEKLRQVETNLGMKLRVAQYALGNERVATTGREDERSFQLRRSAVHALSPMRGAPFPT
jgi:hypothetical protein